SRPETQRRLADRGEICPHRLASIARRQMRLELEARALVERSIDVVTQRDFVILAVHCPVPLNIIRSFMRALCTCDFDVPSDTPRSLATSLCSKPSTS